jgi:hypothetical protein
MRGDEFGARCLRIGLAAGLVVCIAAYAFSLASHETHQAVAAPGAPARIGTAARPGHLYSWRRDGFYGYDLVQSEFSRERGEPPPALAYWYEGQRDGIYHLRQFNGRFVDLVTCADPCSDVTVLTASARTTIELRVDTPLWAVVQDMLHGELEVHR